MPIAIAIMNTRHFDVMKRFFKFVFNNIPLKALTSDMLGVYKKIATSAEVPHQQCVFHWMKYNGKKIKDEIKKEEYSEIDTVNILMKFTEMKEILRCFDKKEAQQKISEFKNHLKKIPPFLKKIIDKFFKDIDKLIIYSSDNSIQKTSSKAETFNSLPQIRHIKHKSKSTWKLLLSLSTIIINYKPNYRTLRFRQ